MLFRAACCQLLSKRRLLSRSSQPRTVKIMGKEKKSGWNLLWVILTYASLAATAFYFVITGLMMISMLAGGKSDGASAKLEPLDIYSRGGYIIGLIVVVCILVTLALTAFRKKILDHEVVSDLMKILLVPVSLGVALSFTVAAGETSEAFGNHLKNLGFYFIGMGIAYIPLLMCREGLKSAPRPSAFTVKGQN